MSLMGLFFLRSLLRSVCVVAFRLFLLFVLLLVFVFQVDRALFVYIFYLFCVPSWRRRPLLTTSLSVFFYLISLHFFSEHVHGLIWFGSVCFVTTAEFVADHLM